jgi:hypothetical protein
MNLIRALTPPQRTGIAALCILGLVLGALGVLSSAARGNAKAGGATPSPNRGVARPPIDVAAPPNTATATFALG